MLRASLSWNVLQNMRFIAMINKIFAASSVFFYSNCTFFATWIALKVSVDLSIYRHTKVESKWHANAFTFWSQSLPEYATEHKVTTTINQIFCQYKSSEKLKYSGVLQSVCSKASLPWSTHQNTRLTTTIDQIIAKS